MAKLVSACLLGLKCRYDGKSKPDEKICQLAKEEFLIPVCPEQLGGRPTPRNPVEIKNGRVVEIDGTEMNLIQLDISVYPGNSGGGLFNLRGELVGIVNAKIVDNDVGRIGFAIPHTRVLDIYLNRLKLGGVKSAH